MFCHAKLTHKKICPISVPFYPGCFGVWFVGVFFTIVVIIIILLAVVEIAISRPAKPSFGVGPGTGRKFAEPRDGRGGSGGRGTGTGGVVVGPPPAANRPLPGLLSLLLSPHPSLGSPRFGEETPVISTQPVPISLMPRPHR